MGESLWLHRAKIHEQGATAREPGNAPLSRTLSLTHSCDRLLNIKLLDVGRHYAPSAGGVQACARDTSPSSEDVEIVTDGETLSIKKTHDGKGVRLSYEENSIWQPVQASWLP
jgi:hypothetical protein